MDMEKLNTAAPRQLFSKGTYTPYGSIRARALICLSAHHPERFWPWTYLLCNNNEVKAYNPMVLWDKLNIPDMTHMTL
jgi:hypothetical protein